MKVEKVENESAVDNDVLFIGCHHLAHQFTQPPWQSSCQIQTSKEGAVIRTVLTLPSVVSMPNEDEFKLKDFRH